MPIMDFLCGGSGDNGLTLADMIECDINSEFSDQLSNYPLVSSPNLSVNTSDCGIQHNSLDSLGLGLINDSKSLNDLSWMQQTVNVNEIQGIIPPENTDPNLLVNPQTGLPVSQAASQNGPMSPLLSSRGTSLVEDVILQSPVAATSSAAATPSVQFITVSTNSIPMSQQQTSVAAIAQTPTITYMQSSNNPSTLKNIQNNTQSSISSVTTYHQTLTQHLLNSNNNHKMNKVRAEEKSYPKPVYSYSCLIAMALKNSDTGALPVSEIYNFMTENFPYFKNAPDGWKNSVRHNLSLNKCFEKIENPKATGNSRKGCLWGLNPAKIEKMEEEITKWRKKDPMSVKRSMARPEKLEMLEKGNIGSHSPHHPNNVKNHGNRQNGLTLSSESELGPAAAVVQRLLQQQQQQQQALSPSSSSSSGASSDGSAPSTPTKVTAGGGQGQVSLIEIRPAAGHGEQKHAVRTIKLENGTQVLQAARILQNGQLHHPPFTTASTLVSSGGNQHHRSNTTSSMSNASLPVVTGVSTSATAAAIKGEFITIKNEPDVVKDEDYEEEEEDEELSDGLDEEEDMDVLSGNINDPSLSDIALHIGSGIWDELSSEGITLDDLPISSSNFNFSFSTNSLTSSPATVQNVTDHWVASPGIRHSHPMSPTQSMHIVGSQKGKELGHSSTMQTHNVCVFGAGLSH